MAQSFRPLLLTRLARLVCTTLAAALAVTLDADEAEAFCRTTTLSGDNQACVVEGVPVFWAGRLVELRLNSNMGSKAGTVDEISSVLQNSASSWSKLACDARSGPSITLTLGSRTTASTVGYVQGSANENLVVFQDAVWPYPDVQQLALTTLTFQKSNGELVDADLEINGTKNLIVSGAVPPNGFDLETILKHELGHVLGLAHTSIAGATMFPTYDAGSVEQRVQKQDDIDGICAAYPPDRLKTPPASGCCAVAAPSKAELTSIQTYGPTVLLGGLLAARLLRRRRQKPSTRAH
jgi:Matrixin